MANAILRLSGLRRARDLVFWGGLLAFALAANERRVAAEPVGEASTAREDREDAISRIPVDQLDEASRAKVEHVLDRVSIFRRMPAQRIRCNQDLYGFLLDYPELVVEVWRALGISQIELERVSDSSFRAIDSEGTSSDIEILFSSPELRVIHGSGEYQGPLFKRPIKGDCLLILSSKYLQQPDGQPYVVNRLDAFVRIDRVGPDVVARTFQPIIGKTADENFTDSVDFIGKLFETAEKNPQGMERLSQKLEVEPALRSRFATLVAEVAAAAAISTMPPGSSAEEPLQAGRPMGRAARSRE